MSIKATDTLFYQFIRISLSVILVVFIIAILFFEWVNYSASHKVLIQKLENLSATYSLLYAEPISNNDLSRIQAYSIALISDSEIAQITLKNNQGTTLDSFISGENTHPDLIKTVTINYASESTFEKVGEMTLALSSHQIDNSLAFHLKSEAALLFVLLLSVLTVIRIAFKQSVAKSLLQIIYQANHDDLTGLLNRRSFENTVKLIKTTDEQINQLLFLDLDGFKALNDNYGHHAGDQALKNVANILRISVRKGDIIARVGGDEFTILLLNCDSSNAQIISEKIRKKIEVSDFDTLGPLSKIHVSIGIATFIKNASLLESFKKADKACYAAKNRGKNQTQIYESL